MRKLVFIMLLAITPLVSKAQATWYQVGGKDLSFSSIIANFSATTVDGNPYQVNLGGSIYTFISGQNVMFAYPNNIGQLPISFLSYSDIKTITLNNNLILDLDSLYRLSNLISFTSNKNCSLTGHIGNNLPSSLTILTSSSSSTTITGTIDSLPPNMNIFNLTGGGTLNGNIDSLPASITSFSNTGSGYMTGNFDSLKSKNTIQSLQLYNNSSIGGNVNALKNIQGLVFIGSSSCYVNLDSLPHSLGVAEFNGNAGNFTGGINNLPPNMTLFSIGFRNGTLDSVSLNALPPGINYFSLLTNTRATSYTAGRQWTPNMRNFTTSTLPLTSSQVDNLLIDLSNTTWVINALLTINGVAAPRTSASNAAVTKLQSMGVIVTTN